MNRIQMYSSSTDLNQGLHRLLALAPLDPEWHEGSPWWTAQPEALQQPAREGRLTLDQLHDAVLAALPRIDRVRLALGLEPTDPDEVASALRRAVISARAHRLHGGRDVYGRPNKAVWDLLIAPVAAALAGRWGPVTLTPGVRDGRQDLPAPAVHQLASTLVDHHTGPRDDGHDACVSWLQTQLEALGFEVRVHRSPDLPPVIEAHREARGLAGHVALYGHYDTVRAGRQWTTDPDVLTEQGDRWMARGISDNKGPLSVRLWALAQLEASPRLTWLIQGEEETGSRFSREVLSAVVPGLDADLYLDETGYHDHEDGTLRLLGRRVDAPVDEVLAGWLDGLRVLAARRGLATRFEERGLNKAVVAGGCPFDQALPPGSRVLALGVNDSAAGIHAANESLPTWTFDLHREQLALLFHAVDRVAS